MAKGERKAAIEARDTAREAARAKHPVSGFIEKVCTNCGGNFHARRGQGQHKRFCDDACASRFRSRCAARGKVIVPLALAWRGGRGKKDTVSAQAYAELTAVLDSYAAEDRAEGRPKLDDYVGGMLSSGFRYLDRKRSNRDCPSSD